MRVPIELARMLKAAGYDKPSDAFCDAESSWSITLAIKKNWNDYRDATSVPEISDVLDWLDIDKGVLVSVMPKYRTGEYMATIAIRNLNNWIVSESPLQAYPSRNDAYLAGIEHVVKTWVGQSSTVSPQP